MNTKIATIHTDKLAKIAILFLTSLTWFGPQPTKSGLNQSTENQPFYALFGIDPVQVQQESVGQKQGENNGFENAQVVLSSSTTGPTKKTISPKRLSKKDANEKRATPQKASQGKKPISQTAVSTDGNNWHVGAQMQNPFEYYPVIDAESTTNHKLADSDNIGYSLPFANTGFGNFGSPDYSKTEAGERNVPDYNNSPNTEYSNRGDGENLGNIKQPSNDTVKDENKDDDAGQLLTKGDGNDGLPAPLQPVTDSGPLFQGQEDTEQSQPQPQPTNVDGEQNSQDLSNTVPTQTSDQPTVQVPACIEAFANLDKALDHYINKVLGSEILKKHGKSYLVLDFLTTKPQRKELLEKRVQSAIASLSSLQQDLAYASPEQKQAIAQALTGYEQQITQKFDTIIDTVDKVSGDDPLILKTLNNNHNASFTLADLDIAGQFKTWKSQICSPQEHGSSWTWTGFMKWGGLALGAAGAAYYCWKNPGQVLSLLAKAGFRKGI
ncbi:MAG: hypothetical protein H6679_04820 [Epsilonproteobacteria bacterium]|nr:hypothetical protein [Campylobacterota bacterium]